MLSTKYMVSHYPVDSVVCIVNNYPHWIAIYPVDSLVHLLNNKGPTLLNQFSLGLQ